MTSFEVHVVGDVPPDLVEDLGGVTKVRTPAETVLRTRRGRRTLDELLDRLCDLSVDLLELRALDTGRMPAYEVRVRGLLGPLLLSNLPHAAAIPVRQHSVLTLQAPDVEELVKRLDQSGLSVELISTRRVPSAG